MLFSRKFFRHESARITFHQTENIQPQLLRHNRKSHESATRTKSVIGNEKQNKKKLLSNEQKRVTWQRIGL